MKLILMTRPEFFVEEHRILAALFDEGLDLLHLRKPNTEPVYSERLLSLLPECHRKKIIVHDHFYLKSEYDLKGIHLNLRNTDLPHNYKGQISCQCHSLEELQSRDAYCDYMFLSPIFKQHDSTAYSDLFSIENLLAMRDERFFSTKVMAAGNLSTINIPIVKDLGFAGCVLWGDVWNHFQPLTDSSFLPLLTHFRKLRRLTQ